MLLVIKKMEGDKKFTELIISYSSNSVTRITVLENFPTDK